MKYYTHFYTLFLWTLSFFKGFSSSQLPDLLIYKGDTIPIYANPLEQLYAKSSSRPNFFGSKQECTSTSCWRGYYAEWEIISNEIYLTGIFSCCEEHRETKADLKELFGNQCVNGKVKAVWVTDTFISPQGKLLHYVHMGYGSVYEKELEFQFKEGKLLGIKSYDNSKSRTSFYRANQKALMKFIDRKINWSILPKIKGEIRVFVQFSANIHGLIDRAEVIRGYNKDFDKEAIRVVKSIPQWDILYSHGKFIRMNYILPIIFNSEKKGNYRAKKTKNKLYSHRTYKAIR
ncbi:hypothetical protein [Flectobacillus roseus]|uniref:hypothetical protein n=1 Tax=Flectobacillus roseus TaxID=502259 RepID=UPI0024B701D9|nr:hypothetical protein [Flectobacillus roseus]MDI9871381.1 hypothetical protein [Flectobacillus roseus]